MALLTFQVKNMSKHLWDKHEPTLIKMHNTFTEKISRLGEQFQEKLKKKTQHWFNRLNKKFKKNGDSDNKGDFIVDILGKKKLKNCFT